MNRIAKKTISLVLAFAITLMSVCAGVRITTEKVSRAAETPQYVSVIKVSNASDKKGAQKELGDDFTILDTDFGKSAGKHAWIGYQTTDNPNLAITDIKVMDEDGDFNYSDYKKLLEDQKKEVEKQLDIVLPAIKEYAKNYDAKYFGAVRMYDVLNCIYEDDSEKGMGRYLLDAGHALNQDPNNKSVLDDLVKVFMQGNNDAILTIESLLSQAQGNKQEKGSWLEKMSELGPTGLQDEYKQAYPKASKKALDKYIKNDLDDLAKLILENLPSFRDTLSEFESSELGKAIEDGDEAAIDAAIDEKMDQGNEKEITDSMSPEEATDVMMDTIEESLDMADGAADMVNAELSLFLKIMPYGDDTSMYDFFMREDLKAEDLYPMAYYLSSGQKSLLEDVGLYGIFVSALSAGKDEDAEPEDSQTVELLNSMTQSVYEGVDRGVFEGDTAITGPAIKRTETTETSFITKNAYYNLGIASLCILGIYGFWRCFDNLYHVQGLYYRIHPNDSIKEAKIDVATRKLDAKHAAYKEQMLNKKINVGTKCMQDEVLFLEKNGYINKAAYGDDITALTRKQYQNIYKSLNATDRATLYGRNGHLGKLTQARNKSFKNIDKLIEKNTSRYITNYNKIVAKADPIKPTFLTRYGARIFTVVCFVAALGMAAYEIYELANGGKEKTYYSEIDMPRYIVDRTYPNGSEKIEFVNYSAGLKANGKKADLHDWKGDSWLNIYTTTDSNAGAPILAQDFGVTVNTTNADADIIPVTRFGDSDAYDITGNKGYLFFRNKLKTAPEAEVQKSETATDENTTDAANTESETEVSSVFGNSSTIWIILLILVIVGGAVGAGIYSRKRKNASK